MQKSLELARLNKEALGEQQMGSYRPGSSSPQGYQAGSPFRMAGEKFSKNIGAQGDFAKDADDEANKDYFTAFSQRLGNFGAMSGDQGGMA